MHEMSIAEALLSQVLEIARENRMSSIRKVELDVGVMQLIEPDALKLCFEAICRGTSAEGVELIQQDIPVVARCGGCGHLYNPDIDLYIYVCDRCGKAEPEIEQGHEIILKSLSGPEMENGASNEDQSY